jgi:uncharacterized protein YukE
VYIRSWLVKEHASFNEVARRLNARRITPPLDSGSGKTLGVWYAKTVSGLFREAHLHGESFYTNKHLPGKRRDLALPALMTLEEFQELQHALDARRPTGRPAADTARTAICLGRILCPCGKRMYVKPMSRGRRAYVCASTHSNWRNIPGNTKCAHVRYHKVDAVDTAAWEAILAYVSGGAVYQDAVTTEPDVSGYADEIERCEQLLADLERREKHTAAMYRRGKLSAATYEDELDDFARDRKTLNRTLKTAREAVARAATRRQSKEALSAAITSIRQRVRAAQPQERRALIHALIPDDAGYGITVHPDGEIIIDAGLLEAPETGTAQGDGQLAANAGGGKVCSPACRARRRPWCRPRRRRRPGRAGRRRRRRSGPWPTPSR